VKEKFHKTRVKRDQQKMGDGIPSLDRAGNFSRGGIASSDNARAVIGVDVARYLKIA